jgi:uncharacterized protein
VAESVGTGADAANTEITVRLKPDLARFAAQQAATQSAGVIAAPTGVVAFVGRCLKGPFNEPLLVTSFSEFQQRFGGLWMSSTLSYAVEQFFEHGGERAVIVRVISGGQPPTIDLRAGDDTLILGGVCPGSREFLRISIDYDGISAQDSDLFNLVVQRVRTLGSEMVEAQEIFRRMSILAGSAREIGRLLAASSLIRVVGPLPRQRPDITRGADPRSLIGYVECNNDGDDGDDLSDYDLIGNESSSSGLFALNEGPSFNFLCIPPPARDRDVGMSTLVVAARFCRRHHALLLVDPPHAWRTAQDAIEGIRSWPFHSADALMYFPPIAAMDRLRGRLENFAPSAAAVGLIVRDDRSAEAFWRGGGETSLLRPPAQLSSAISDIQRQQLAQRGVNCLNVTRTATRVPILPRTLSGELSASLDGRMLTARRLALFVSASIERGTAWVTLEGNTQRSRERVYRQVERFLAQLATAGALAGLERNRDFFVLCDERLNTPLEQASGEFKLVYGYRSKQGSTKLNWLVTHRAAGSQTRAVSLNQLAIAELR